MTSPDTHSNPLEEKPRSAPIFTLPSQQFVNTTGWGPTVNPKTLEDCLGVMRDYPFEPSMKQERLGRVCDFTYTSFQRTQRSGGGAAANAAAEEDADFQLVDSRPIKVNKSQNRYMRRPMVNQQQKKQMQNQSQMTPQQQQLQQRFSGTQQARAMQQQAQRQQQWQRNNRQRQLAEWSIEPLQDWVIVDEQPLSQLPKLHLDSSTVKFEDIEWRGELRMYNKEMDRIGPKNTMALSDTYHQTRIFYWTGTADDPLLVSTFDNDSTVTVAATDQILACLMAASQSRQSWHLYFHKLNKRIFIDKQNGSSVDSVTVDETSKDAPLQDHPVKINRPAELSAEAMKINQNFSQQILVQSDDKVSEFPPPPFVESKDVPGSKLYRYRFITIPAQHKIEQIKIVMRAEIDCCLPGEPTAFVTARALNEYDPYKYGKSWKTQLESQKGALLAQEAKNNHCKLGKWVAQAILAGCEHLKLGYISRLSPEANQKHAILNIQGYRVKELGTQIGMREDNAWGVVRAIIGLVLNQPDGRYILVKDPVKPTIKLYRTSTETLADEAALVGGGVDVSESAKEEVAV